MSKSARHAQKPEAGSRSTRTISATDELRAAILAGTYRPGERLQEVRVGASLGVSRTPVRIALQALAAEGLLEYEPNCGYSVRTFNRAEILNAFETRAALEGLAARFAAERGLKLTEQTRIEQILAEGDALLAHGDPSEESRPAYARMNAAFHDAIHNASETRMIREMLRLTQLLPMSSHENLVAFEYGKIRHRHDEHHRVLEAIIRRDGSRAEMIMREHVSSIKTGLMRLSGIFKEDTPSDILPMTLQC
jgi:GntR family transcriptional regulator of vanillate catabolism